MKAHLATAATLVLGAACLAGCWGPSQNAATTAAEPGSVTLHVVPKIGALGDRQVLAVMTPMTEADVATLEIKLQDVTASPTNYDVAFAAKTGPALSGPTLDNTPITFNNLRHNHQYLIHRKAVNTSNVQISKNLPPVPINVGTDTIATTSTIVVELMDKVFDGQATSTIDIVDGDIIATNASEAITF